MERKEIGADESWQIEYLPGHFERIHHVRKKYACAACEHNGDNPQMETAAKPETAIDKGMAGPGLLAYIVTSKFSDYLPLYRLEDIFARQGFEISRATQSVWCGDMADLVEPLWELMAEARARLARGGHRRHHHAHAEHRQNRQCAHVGLCRRRRPSLQRLRLHAEPRAATDRSISSRDYNQVLLADAYGGYNGVVAGNDITRAGCWAHLRRKFIEAEKAAPEIAREAIEMVRAALCGGEAGARRLLPKSVSHCARQQSAPVLAQLREKLLRLERAVAAQASHGRGGQLRPEPVDGTERVLLRRRGAHRQQRQRTRNEARGSKSQEQPCSSAIHAAAERPPSWPA